MAPYVGDVLYLVDDKYLMKTMKNMKIVVWNNINKCLATSAEIKHLVQNKYIVLDYSTNDDYLSGQIIPKLDNNTLKLMYEIRIIESQT